MKEWRESQEKKNVHEKIPAYLRSQMRNLMTHLVKEHHEMNDPLKMILLCQIIFRDTQAGMMQDTLRFKIVVAMKWSFRLGLLHR